jgi:hypothetical protein
MDVAETIRLLKSLHGVDLFEVYHKTTFDCYRERKDGGTEMVTVEILDAGPDVDHGLRYHCKATSERGKLATSNPAGTIQQVLATLHWFELDREE